MPSYFTAFTHHQPSVLRRPAPSSATFCYQMSSVLPAVDPLTSLLIQAADSAEQPSYPAAQGHYFRQPQQATRRRRQHHHPRSHQWQHSMSSLLFDDLRLRHMYDSDMENDYGYCCAHHHHEEDEVDSENELEFLFLSPRQQLQLERQRELAFQHEQQRKKARFQQQQHLQQQQRQRQLALQKKKQAEEFKLKEQLLAQQQKLQQQQQQHAAHKKQVAAAVTACAKSDDAKAVEAIKESQSEVHFQFRIPSNVDLDEVKLGIDAQGQLVLTYVVQERHGWFLLQQPHTRVIALPRSCQLRAMRAHIEVASRLLHVRIPKARAQRQQPQSSQPAAKVIPIKHAWSNSSPSQVVSARVDDEKQASPQGAAALLTGSHTKMFNPLSSASTTVAPEECKYPLNHAADAEDEPIIDEDDDDVDEFIVAKSSRTSSPSASSLASPSESIASTPRDPTPALSPPSATASVVADQKSEEAASAHEDTSSPSVEGMDTASDKSSSVQLMEPADSVVFSSTSESLLLPSSSPALSSKSGTSTPPKLIEDNDDDLGSVEKETERKKRSGC